MVPLQPVSVKFTDEERARLKALAKALGWSESQVMRDAVEAVVIMVRRPPIELEPKIVAMARQALKAGGDSSLLDAIPSVLRER